jgi:hypothetical protein
VQDRIEKVAFDVVRFKDGDNDLLWKIESSDEGDFIVPLYADEVEAPIVAEASVNPWEVIVSKANNLHVFYKGEEIVNVASSKLALATEQLATVPRFLPKKLASSKTLVSALLKELSTTARTEVLRKYPELS